MKKILSFLVTLTLLSTVSAFGAPIYETEEEQIVTSGVTLKNVQRFYGDYALNINCITADLKNKNLNFELLKHGGGSDKISTVRDMAAGEEKTVVAINGDFFSTYKADQNFSLGIEVKDGELLQSHINSDMAAGFFSDGELFFDYISFIGELEAPDGEKTVITHINKPTDYYGAVLMYTSHFNGGISPFLPSGITVVTVSEDEVTAKGVSLGGTVPIPEDGCILVIDDNMTPFLDHKFSVGDKVKIKVEFTPSIEDVQTAFGGGTLLLKDGEKTKITHNVSGNNPRSAIGTNADGTMIYMITVDGRQTASRGVSLDTLADICLEMGCTDAINLDGGGSTAMVGKTLENSKLHNINYPTESRKVINALAITSDAVPGKAVGYFIEPENEYVLSGDSVGFKLTAYDKNYNVPEKIPGKMTLKLVSGQGSIRDNMFYPKGGNSAEIAVYYDGKKTDSCKVNIINEVSGIIAPREIKIEEEETFDGTGKIKVFDKNGKTAIIKDMTLLYPKFDPEKVSLGIDGTIKALKEGASEIKLTHGYAKRSIEVICGDYEIDGEKVNVADSMEKETTAGFRFDIFASSAVNTLFDRAVYAHSMKVLQNGEETAIIGEGKYDDLTPDDLSPVTADAFSEKDIFAGKVITISQSLGKFARGQQWKKFADAVENASQQNIFVISDESIGFVSDLDRQAFHTLLSEKAKDKNVFVIYSGDENFCRIADGVRYITIADPRAEDNISDSVKNACYLSFRITNNSINYTFNKLFD